jgi:UDP-glucose 4-epimerase
MNVLVTGGLGFIGSHVAEAFCVENTVVVVDLSDKIDSYSGKLGKSCELIGCDISSWDEIKELGSRSFDLIIHCAAQSGGYGGLETPQLDCDWNAKGTLNVCELAMLTGKPKIVYTSSVAVYGGGDDLIESSQPTPISNYGVSKFVGELYLERYRHHDISSVSLRLFNTYGPGQDLENTRQGVVSIFLEQLLHGNDVKMTGSSKRYRDCIHVHDVVSAIAIVASRKDEIVGAVNVCNREAITMKTIVETLGRVMGKKTTITNIGGYPGDQFGYYGNNTKLKSLGWKPRFDLKNGFEDFYQSVCKSGS